MNTPRLIFTPPRARLAVLVAAILLLPWKSPAEEPTLISIPPAPPAGTAVPSPSPSAETVTPTKGGILLNFQGASLSDVLNYLSEAAGFVIVQEAPVTGTVNIISKQPVSAEEAVDLLNTVLVEKGYVALRNGRILKIVSRKDAQKRDLPVELGSNPDQIPKKDQMVTQILPLHYGDATKLIENLRPLLSDNANMTANEGSNSILLTDTQINVKRIAQIIQAIDTSISGIGTIRVFPLQYADSKGLATVITQLFATTSSTNADQNRNGRRGGWMPPGFGQEPAATTPQSEARQATARVVAVADEQTNSLIVSASEDIIPSIADVVQKIDTGGTEVTNTRIFKLAHADAVELAQTLTSLYYDSTTQPTQTRNGNGQPGGFPWAPQNTQNAQSTAGSRRALLQARVVAVGDPRTNTLLVNTGPDLMTQIAQMVTRLDASDSKRQHVYIHHLQHADPDIVASVLRGMLGDQSGATNTANGASRLTERSSTGASTDTTTQSNTPRSSVP